MNSAPRRFAIPLAALLALAPFTPAGAQTPLGLKTHFRLVNSMPGQTTPGELRPGDGWSIARPLVTHGVNHVSSTLGMYSNSDFTAVADYGYLHFSGFGSAESVQGNGLFLWVDDWIGAEPRAQYRDRLFVTSTTLPAGTPAVVEFQLTLSGSTTIVDTDPNSSISSAFTATHPGTDLALSLTAPGVATGNLDTFVGDTIDVHGLLRVYLYANGMMQAGPRTGSIAADLTAQVTTTPLTAGVSLTSSSTPVDAPVIASAAGFLLEGARPNPVRSGPVTVHFTLPSAQPATLSLFDVRGRRVAEVPVGGLGEGRQAVDLARDERLASGVYYVRLSTGRDVRTAPVVVLE